jgi:ribonuclease HII
MWLIGVDEAGYGPNLGPLVMTAVGCRVPDDLAGADLWDLLAGAVRKNGDDDGRILVNDSKQVYDPAGGIGDLERGVLAALWRHPLHADANIGHLLTATCTDSLDDLRGEGWFTGDGKLPLQVEAEEVTAAARRFDRTWLRKRGQAPFSCRGVVVPAPRFNALADAADSKGAVLAHSLCRLLANHHRALDGDDALTFVVDKHGGRNSYAALIQHALPEGVVLAELESHVRSTYRVIGLSRDVRLTFQPRADAEHFCVALASMAAKYLRERLMEDFNRFWLAHVPGLKRTAGYPADAARFMAEIRPAAQKLGIAEDAIWRKR